MSIERTYVITLGFEDEDADLQVAIDRLDGEAFDEADIVLLDELTDGAFFGGRGDTTSLVGYNDAGDEVVRVYG